MMNKIKNLIADEAGISSVEYGVLLAFIVAGLIVVVTALSTAVGNTFTAATTELTPAP